MLLQSLLFMNFLQILYKNLKEKTFCNFDFQIKLPWIISFLWIWFFFHNKYILYNKLREKGWTWKLEKMVGWRRLMSNAGMTTLVKVWCNFVSPNFSLISLCKYLPLYCGPNRVLVNFTIDENKFQHLYIYIYSGPLHCKLISIYW